MDTNKLIEQYGINTFDDKEMKRRLPKDIYEEFCSSIKKRDKLSNKVVEVIAEKLKEWALEKGCTHFTHWFSSLNGLIAEKHNSFLEPCGKSMVYEFNSDLLKRGEVDASSFPNGGLRSVSKAKGYTYWDCTSSPFIRDKTLFIPSLFYSYRGESLDNKIPLLKSCEALNREGVKLLTLLGEEVDSIDSYVGVEQEYFLIPEELYRKRLDLRLTGRTLFGFISYKEQEMNDHYFSSLSKNIADFMKELDMELWKLGIPSKIKHNEAAPSQHEIACVYRKVNITSDNNLLLMQLLKDIAKKYGLRCLLYEKPFKGINGSGKHNNWSVITNTNINLFESGPDPLHNLPFLATLACIIKGVDEYADLLRLSIVTPGNDFRLGGNEAPPTIISLSLGEKINEIIYSLIEGDKLNKNKENKIEGVTFFTLDLTKDNSDRNRTSPFALTRNKFEFRGVGSSQSIDFVNTILNSILAKEMKEMSRLIEEGKAPLDVIKTFLKEHKRIIFEGDGYSSSWKEEALKRGLQHKKNNIEAIEVFKNKKMTNILIELDILNQIEIDARYEILLDNYCKTLQVEASTVLMISKKQIYPIVIKYLEELSRTSLNLKKLNVDTKYLLKEIRELSSLVNQMQENMSLLEVSYNEIKEKNLSNYQKAKKYRDNVLTRMDKLREIVDNIETRVNKNKWPIPTYVDLLFSN